MNKRHLSKRHPSIGLMIALLLFSMLVAACGGAATPSPASQPAPAEEEQPQEQEQPQDQETETAAETEETTDEPSAESQSASGTLRYGIDFDISTWDPHRARANIAICYYQLVYDALIAEKPDGSLIPGLATAWEQSTETITFTLREDVVFHDGTPFNAETAKANLLHAQQSDYTPVADQMSAVESIDVLDDTHIQLNLSRPDASLLSNLSRHAGMMVSPAVLNTDITTPVGTGPWTLNTEETEPTVRYVFDVFDNFWDPSVQGVERIEIVLLQNISAQTNALRSGQIDGGWIPSEQAKSFEEEGYTILSNEAYSLGFAIIDRKGEIVPAFADERVRLALNYAIDRELFIETILAGYGTAITQRSQPGQYGYADDIADLSYNPEKAVQLLTEADITNLEFQVPSRIFAEQYNQALAGFFDDIGVTMKVQPVNSPVESEIASGKWAASLVTLNERHISNYVDNRILADGFLNPFHIVEQDLEELAAQAKQLPPDEAEPLWAEIARETAERGIIIHIATFEHTVAVNSKVKGGSAGYMMPAVLMMRGVTIDE